MTIRNIYFFVFLLAISCQTSKKTTYLKIPNQGIMPYFKYHSGFQPLVSIHRGGGDIDGFPENCLESFQYLSKKIPSIIECDIEMTKDSVLFMMHDNSLDRTTTGKGKIMEQNWENIKNIYLKDNFGKLTKFHPPLLSEILKWGKNKVYYTLDVKKNTPYKKVVEMVENQKAENYSIIITYDVKQALEVYQLNPNLLISVTIRDLNEYERYSKAGIPDKNMVAFIGTREPKKEFCDFLHQKQICTILGTLGNLDKMAQAKGEHHYSNWVKNGADILSTDRPFEAFQSIQHL